jgi:hypothetical protein
MKKNQNSRLRIGIFIIKSIIIVVLGLALTQKLSAQHVGATCEWNYSGPEDIMGSDTAQTQCPSLTETVQAGSCS